MAGVGAIPDCRRNTFLDAADKSSDEMRRYRQVGLVAAAGQVDFSGRGIALVGTGAQNAAVEVLVDVAG